MCRLYWIRLHTYYLVFTEDEDFSILLNALDGKNVLCTFLMIEQLTIKVCFFMLYCHLSNVLISSVVVITLVFLLRFNLVFLVNTQHTLIFIS